MARSPMMGSPKSIAPKEYASQKIGMAVKGLVIQVKAIAMGILARVNSALGNASGIWPGKGKNAASTPT